MEVYHILKELTMKIKIFFVTLIIIAATIMPGKAAAKDSEPVLPNLPEIRSSKIVLMDADSGEVLYANNPDAKSYPASTTKLLTALLAVENSSLSDEVIFSKKAVDSLEPGDANVAISEGEILTMEQALHCLILRSANEVAYGIAEHIGGDMTSFTTIMNNKLEAIGAKNSHFTNASGLHNSLHYTTPYDMALIAKECFNNKTLMQIAGYSGLYTINPTNKSKFTRYYKPRFQMLEGGEFAYRYCVGGKTGYTDEGGNCVVSFAQKDDLRLICVVFDSGAESRYTDSIALFDYYFDNYKKLPLNGNYSGLSSDSIDILDLLDSIDSSTDVSISFEKDAYLLVPKEADMSDLTCIVTYADNIAYNGREGGFANLSFYYRNIDVGNATLYASSHSDSKSLAAANSVPTLNYKVDNEKRESTHYINVLYILYTLLSVGAVILIILWITHRTRKRTRRRSKRLRF